MENNIRQKIMFLIITPLVVSYVINLLLTIGYGINSSLLLIVTVFLIYLWKIVAIFFWLYVGMQFGKLVMSKVKSFILGNSLWIISFLLFIWQFVLLDEEKRSTFIAGLSQDYISGFTGISTQLMKFIDDTASTSMIGSFSYLIMIIVFTIGFIFTSKKD